MHAYGCIGLLVDEWDESINQSIVRYYCINTVLVLVLYQFSSVQSPRIACQSPNLY